MSALIDIRDVHYRYPDADHDALRGVTWSAQAGSTVLIAGRSGAGKSTLLQCLTGLVPHFHGGHFSGAVDIAGMDTRHAAPHDLARLVGYVFQDPESQIVTDRVEDEIAFTMEQLGVPPKTMRERVAEIGEALQITHLMDRSTTTLSGGERQLVTIAGAIAHQPWIVILDEPTSQLDRINAARVVEVIDRLARERDMTTLIAEHRLERILPIASEVVEIDRGQIRSSEAGISDVPPVRAARQFTPESDQPELLNVQNLTFGYGDSILFADVSFTVQAGEIIALSGPNGSGKTTLLKMLCGLLSPAHGSITVQGRSINALSIQEVGRLSGYVPQQPSAILHQETVLDEILFTLRAQNLQYDPGALPEKLGLGALLDSHPLDLSGGERQRAAIAAIGVAHTPLLLLDEPTRGLSKAEKQLLADYLRSRSARGQSTIVATHDEDFIFTTAGRTLDIEGQNVQERRIEPEIDSSGANLRDPAGSRLLTGSI